MEVDRDKSSAENGLSCEETDAGRPGGCGRGVHRMEPGASWDTDGVSEGRGGGDQDSRPSAWRGSEEKQSCERVRVHYLEEALTCTGCLPVV